ncbi:putative isochorismatase family protein YaaI [Pullulanibacillus camelliae]|uniref:Putative isochorismatase family protein YaaI n=1 Tax=Pullulanibacillus camelliae TaxID=1707096 RepID=A0A8J2YEN4_9BACL|nr:isochorismatase family cysteine hydrolase [Pullulanibacillus camelliae]GGE37995.1 putative isochorismatase family protein YaaI [Pullulanibacillus camelliae]
MKHSFHRELADKHSVALLIIDVINTMAFKEKDLLLKEAERMIQPLVELKERVKEKGVPVIYVNDNYGAWQSDLNHIIKQAEQGPGSWLVEALHPQEDDYFVVKPKHSGFFSTPLATLLNHLGVTTLILTGVAGNICVLFTANDAYMRDYDVVVPEDCCASNTKEDNDYALRLMKNILGATINPAHTLDIDALIEKASQRMKRALYEG